MDIVGETVLVGTVCFLQDTYYLWPHLQDRGAFLLQLSITRSSSTCFQIPWPLLCSEKRKESLADTEAAHKGWMSELAGLARPLCVPRCPTVGSGLCRSLADRWVLGGSVGPTTTGLFRSSLADCSGHPLRRFIAGKTPGPPGFWILVALMLLHSDQLP